MPEKLNQTPLPETTVEMREVGQAIRDVFTVKPLMQLSAE